MHARTAPAFVRPLSALLLLGALGCHKPAAPPPTPPTPAIAPSPLVAPSPAPPAPPPAVVAPARTVSPVVQIALGHRRACAARADGQVVCWGAGVDYGDGRPPIAAPTLVRGIADAVQVAGDSGRWCARRRGGEVRCWDERLHAGDAVATDAIDLSARCVLRASGAVACGLASDAPLHDVADVGPARALSHGAPECAILRDGSVRCWGANPFHQLPGATGTEASGPVTLPGLSGVEEVGLSEFATNCARMGASVSCWGGEGSARFRPSALRGVAGAAHLTVGEYHACALTGGGRVLCWGANGSGQLGRPTTLDRSDAPIAVEAVTDAVEVAVGGGEPCGGCGSTCVRDAAGAVRCWGQINDRDTPTPVALDAAPAP